MQVKERPAKVLLVHAVVDASASDRVILVPWVGADVGVRLFDEYDAAGVGIVADFLQERVLPVATVRQVGGVGPAQVDFVTQHKVHILLAFTDKAASHILNARVSLSRRRPQFPPNSHIHRRPPDLPPCEVRPVARQGGLDHGSTVRQLCSVGWIEKMPERHGCVQRALLIVTCEDHHESIIAAV